MAVYFLLLHIHQAWTSLILSILSVLANKEIQCSLKNHRFVRVEMSRLGSKYLPVLYLCEHFINNQS